MPNQVASLVVKIAERCNLNCSYCYMYNQGDQSYLKRPKFMSPETYTNMLDCIKRYCAKRGSQISICFHGGEPMLVGPDRLQAMALEAREYLGGYLGGLKIQTNATLIDENWAKVLKRNRIGVGISMDGPKDINDMVRVDHAGRGSHDAIVRGLRYLQGEGIDCSILSVVNPGQAGADVYRHFRELGVKKILFLLPDVDRDRKEDWYGDRGPTPVADYLIPIFDAWMAEDDPEVKLHPFWDMLLLARHGHCRNDAFGNPPVTYLIIESDGDIQPLDVLRGCDESMVNTGLNVNTHSFDDIELQAPLLHKIMNGDIPLSETCQKCSYHDVCGGGYLPHRYSKENGFDNPSTWCDDIQKLYGHMLERLYSYAC